MGNTILYLNIIKGQLAIRQYKTKKNIYVFKWFDVINCMGYSARLKNDYWEEHINDIFDYLIHGVKLVWVDSFGIDRLTLKGLGILWRRDYSKESEEEYRVMIEWDNKFYGGRY